MDVGMNLRKLEFPNSVARALEYFVIALEATKQTQVLKDKNEEAFEAIVNEFVFGLVNRSKSKFSPMEEIQAVNAVLTFFSGSYDNATMLAVFRLLFNNLMTNDIKSVFFTKVLSCAINIQNRNFLELTATWIETHGCKSDIVLFTVKSLMDDHYSGVSISHPFRHLPSCSTLLTCHIITSITHLYSLPGQDGNFLQLTSVLLELICDWMTSDPIICLVSLYPKYSQFLHSSQKVLWTSPTKPNTQTAIPGLVKWCVRAPFLKFSCHLKPELSCKEVLKNNCSSLKKTKEEISNQLWSRLFFLLIKTVSIFPKVPGSNLFELITLADMLQVVQGVSSSCSTIQEAVGSDRQSDDNIASIMQLANDRVGQILQMSLATGAFRCCLVDLQSIFDILPQSRLLKLVHDHHNPGTLPSVQNDSKD